MKNLIFMLMLLSTFPITLTAQWTQQQIETSNTLLDIQFVNNAVGYISEEGGNIYKTTNSGLEWFEQNSGTNDFLNSISFIDENNGWSIGMNTGSVIHTSDGGGTWNTIATGIGTNILDIQFVTNQIGWAVGNGGQIYKSADAGNKWASQTSITTNNLWSVNFVSENIGYIAGNNIILKTTDSGITWSVSYQSPSGSKGEGFRCIYFLDKNIGWAVGQDWDTGDAAIFGTTNGGATWERQSSGVNGIKLQSVHFIDDLNGWTSGEDGTLLSTEDGGQTWISERTGTDNFLRSVFATDNSNIWAVGVFGLILKNNEESSQKYSIYKFDGQSADERAGYSVSNAGDLNGDGFGDVIVGAKNWTSNGKAYIYYGGQNMDGYIDQILSGHGSYQYFGESVSTAGDVNNDGYDDLIVGEYGNDQGGRDAGRAYLYYGGPNMDNGADLHFSVNLSYSNLGKSVSDAGDVNGDGYDDIILGAWTTTIPSTATGRAYIYFGGSPMNNTYDVQLSGESSYNYFGESVSKAGDVNGDGYDDVIVGAYGNENGGSYAGRAYIYFGGPNMDNEADIVLTGESGNYFGNSVSYAGDINGDGYDDVIVGSTSDINGPLDVGKAHIFFGGLNMNNDADIVISGKQEGAQFGYSVSTAGDVNNDGFSDIIIGEKDNSDNGLGSGKAYVYYGGTNMDTDADFVMYGEKVGDEFGTSVASAGDVNGDGYSELFVGAPFNDIGGDNAGRSYLYFTKQQPITPIILIQPTNKIVDAGQQATFTIQASCDDPIGYQWWRSPYVSSEESKIVGATSNQLLILNTEIETHTNSKYVCEVYNKMDHNNLWINSNEVSLTVNQAPANAPIIKIQPSNVIVKQGDDATFILDAECEILLDTSGGDILILEQIVK